MAQLIKIEDRRIVPLWKSFAASIPELKVSRKDEPQRGDISAYINDWQRNPNIANAGDLIGAAIIQNGTDDPNVKAAVEYVLNHKDLSSNPLYSVASGLHGEEMQVVESMDDLKHTQQIAYLKAILRNYPKDAICHVEIARLYLMLGQQEHAKYHMDWALRLDSNNRYVVRAASRYYLHEKNKEKAQQIIRACKMYKRDPWLLAAEISLSQLRGTTSRDVKRGLELIESGNYSLFELTELCSAIGTEEMIHGAFTKSRRLFAKSLISPNDNSVAQAQWVNENNNMQVEGIGEVQVPEKFWEANAYRYFANEDYKRSLECSKRWICQEMFSTRATMYAYRIAATYMQDMEEGEKILRNSIKSNKGNNLLLNDYAYTLALNDKPEEAARQISRVKIEGEDNLEVLICATATRGLVAFRLHDIERGHQFYREAIELSLHYTAHPYYNNSAILNYCREVLLWDATKENVESIKGVMEKMTDLKVIKENKDLQLIYEKVESLLKGCQKN